MSTNIGEATVRIRPETSGFAAEARRGTTRGLARVGAAVGATLVAGGALRAISQQIGAAGQLQTQLREVNTLTGLVGPAAERSFNQFTRGVAGLSRELGVAQQELTGGLYQAISAGVPRGNAIDFLRIATRAGIAGVTDTETAVDGLTTVINAFGLEAADVERVSDTLFQAVRGGKTTFDELAASLFQVAPVAANAGVDIQTVSAALATLTAQGTPTAVATTQLRQAIQSLIAPSVEAERRLLPVFRDAGFESGQAALAALGLERTLRLVADAADGDATTLQRLVGSTEALQAVLGLTGQGAGKFTAELAAQEDAAGATSKALAEIEKSAGRSFQRAGNAARNFGLLVGDAAAPAAARLADGLEEALNRASESAGFRRGVAGIADSIADGLTSPETLATLATLGTTGAAAFGAVNQAATATAPILRETLQLIGGIAGSSFGAPLLIGALAFRTLGGAAALALPRIQALRAAQAASATAATAAAAQQAAAARASVSAIGLVGPSSARAAAQATTGFSRASIAARGLGTGLLALSGGPVGATVLGLSAVAAGAFILSQRQSLAEQSTARFNDSLREQQDAASGAAAALNRVKDATSALAQSRVGVDQARQGVEQARADVQAVRAAPASQFGGEAQQRQALADATNRLRAAELGRLRLLGVRPAGADGRQRDSGAGRGGASECRGHPPQHRHHHRLRPIRPAGRAGHGDEPDRGDPLRRRPPGDRAAAARVVAVVADPLRGDPPADPGDRPVDGRRQAGGRRPPRTARRIPAHRPGHPGAGVGGGAGGGADRAGDHHVEEHEPGGEGRRPRTARDGPHPRRPAPHRGAQGGGGDRRGTGARAAGEEGRAAQGG